MAGPTTEEPRELPDQPPVLQNVYNGNANVVVQAFKIVGDLVFPGSGANPWPALGSFAAALAMSASAGLLGWLALGRLGSEGSPVGAWGLAAGSLV